MRIVIAYIGEPAVAWLAQRGLNRSTATCIILFALVVLVLLAPLLLLPVIVTQVLEVAQGLPNAIAASWAWLLDRVPGLNRLAADTELVDLTDYIKVDANSLAKAGALLGFFGRNIGSLFGLLATLFITPLVAFYLMRDWQVLVRAAKRNIPTALQPTVINITTITDNVLGEFLRAQLMVMILMAIIYSVLLAVAGAPFAIAIGVITGLLCFVPYVGFLFGVILAFVMTLLNLEAWVDLAWIAGALAIGYIVENFWLTPQLLGERTGLGPVAVLLALALMGSLFGFAGVLLAIPCAAVIFALWRHYQEVLIGQSAQT